MAAIASAVFVKATIKSRCRAGYVFNNEEETRIEIASLPDGALAMLEKDPYLKLTYEREGAEGGIFDGELTAALKRAELAEKALSEITEDRDLLKGLNDEQQSKLIAATAQAQDLKTELDKKEAELTAAQARIAELEAATTKGAKK